MKKIYSATQSIQFLCPFFFFLFLSAGTIYAQTVNGTVTDATTSQGLAGASIVVKGGTQSTTSDASGNFSIQVPNNNAVLMVSYVGYVNQEIAVGNNLNLNIALQPASGELAQVVVVGYGTQNKRDITGSVKSLRNEAFNKGIINSPQQLLQGKVAGVNVTSVSGEPGVGMGITIRGRVVSDRTAHHFLSSTESRWIIR